MKRGYLILSCIAALLLFAGPAALAKMQFIGIGTGGTGGVYYPYGGGLAEIWTKNVKGVQAVAEVTGASVENVRLADRGETVIGEIMGDVGYQAYFAQGRFEGKPQKISGMFVMYPNVYQVVTLAKSEIKTLDDLKGKRVSVGAPGSGTEFMTNLVFKALGLSYNEFSVHRLSFVENANALRDGTIDVGIWCVATPTSSIMDLATTHKIRILSFTPEQVKKVTSEYGFYSDYEMPGGIYAGVDKPVNTISVWNVVICSSALKDELVYDLVKAVYDHHDYLMKIHPFAEYTTPENTLKHSPIPLHPGAIKYYQDKGLKIPERLMPKR